MNWKKTAHTKKIRFEDEWITLTQIESVREFSINGTVIRPHTLGGWLDDASQLSQQSWADSETIFIYSKIVGKCHMCRSTFIDTTLTATEYAQIEDVIIQFSTIQSIELNIIGGNSHVTALRGHFERCYINGQGKILDCAIQVPLFECHSTSFTFYQSELIGQKMNISSENCVIGNSHTSIHDFDSECSSLSIKESDIHCRKMNIIHNCELINEKIDEQTINL